LPPVYGSSRPVKPSATLWVPPATAYRASMQRRGIPDEVIEEQLQKFRNRLWCEFTGYAALPPGLRA